MIVRPVSASSSKKPDVVSRGAVELYLLVHGRLHLPGAGWLIRKLAPRCAGLQSYPFPVPEVGVAILDFRDGGAFGMVNSLLGEFENDAPLLRAFEVLLKPKSVLWDVGANIGYLAQTLMRKPFDLSYLHAFEPSPAALLTLQSLFADNPRASVHPVALGDKEETLEMNVSSIGSPLNSLVRKLPGGSTISVPVRRADDYRREHGLQPPDLVKIDVEGFEPQVLAGMADTIKQARPIIVFEHLWLKDPDIHALMPPRYDLLFLLDDGTTTMDFSRRSLGANGILLPQERPELKARLTGQPLR